jgi:hypothetical protein
MINLVYILCSALSLTCAILLFRKYRLTRTYLLIWGALSFGVFALNNIFLVVDMMIFPYEDLNGPFWRNLLSAISGLLLLFGLIWEIV